MQLRSKWVLALALGVLQPSVVHADAPRALMMAPMGDADEEMTSNAMTEVRATLEHQGVVFVMAPRGLSLECETQACRSAAAVQAGANIAVTVLVWQPTSFRAEGRVEVALTDVAGETVGAEVDFAADELLAAVQAARGALERFGQRARVALEITGIEGAAVLVDGRPVGVVPYRGSLGTGPHRIRVVADGEVLFTREVNVEQGAEPILLRVDGTDSSETDAEDAASERTGGSTAGVAAGSALGVAGVGAVLWVVVEAARSGCSDRNALGECTSQRELRRGPAVAVGVLGAAMLATGVVLILRSRGSSEPGPEVSARVSPTSAALNVSF
ncbi:MAG: PEGA domain-containing protein [Sandaracinaceae bacterium]|nr:PEGA domain-containing protein [Sandaracinaceae bacterium]